MTNLNELHMESLIQLTPKSIEALSKTLTKLEILNMKSCSKLTKQCIPYLKKLKQLRYLNLMHCNAMKNEDTATLFLPVLVLPQKPSLSKSK